MSEILKKLDEPMFIKIAFYPTPDSPADWRGYAVQTAGNDTYGKVVLLENTYKSPSGCDMPLFKEIEVCEWEWDGGFPVEEEVLPHVKKLYEDYLKKEKIEKERPQKETKIKNSCISMKEWKNNTDLLQKGSKIYDVNYEENGLFYTVCGVFKASKDSDKYYLIPGIYYNVYVDRPSNMASYYSIPTGYYSIPNRKIDIERYFSSPERAHEAYVKLNGNETEMEK